MSGFEIDPVVLVAHAGRREDDAITLAAIRTQVGQLRDPGPALGSLCSWILGDVDVALDQVEGLVDALARSSEVIAEALHETARELRETDETVAACFGGSV